MKVEYTFKHWMHVMHDDGVKVLHFSSHVLHEKSFWGIVAILGLLAILVTLVVMFGELEPMEEYRFMTPHVPYF